MKALCLLGLFVEASLAQTTDTIASGRPGVFIPPYVVGTGVLQVQSGIDYLKSEAVFFTETTQSNNFLRLGFNEWFETNLLLNMQSDIVSNPTVSNRSGLSQVVPGVRFNLVNEDTGWIQGFGVQLDFSMQDVDEDYKTGTNSGGFTLVSYHQLNEIYSFTSNYGISYSDFDGFIHSLRSAIGFSLGQDLSGFVEIYAFFIEDSPSEDSEDKNYTTAYADMGLAYLLNKDIQLDISAGYGHNLEITEVFVSTGISFRTNVLE